MTEDSALNASQRKLLEAEASLHAFTLELGGGGLFGGVTCEPLEVSMINSLAIRGVSEYGPFDLKMMSHGDSGS